LFSFVGIYGNLIGVGGDPPAVARTFGSVLFGVIALLMISSSISVVDSTFSSTARLIGLQLMGYIEKKRVLKPEETEPRHILVGRIAMVIMAIIGVLPLLASPNIIQATTVSGTMVIGLAPNFLLMNLAYKPKSDLGRTYPLSFHMSFFCGVILGICQVSNKVPSSWNLGHGDFANLLGVNVYGSILCFGLFCLGLPFHSTLLKNCYTKVHNIFKQSDERLQD